MAGRAGHLREAQAQKQASGVGPRPEQARATDRQSRRVPDHRGLQRRRGHADHPGRTAPRPPVRDRGRAVEHANLAAARRAARRQSRVLGRPDRGRQCRRGAPGGAAVQRRRAGVVELRAQGGGHAARHDGAGDRACFRAGRVRAGDRRRRWRRPFPGSAHRADRRQSRWRCRRARRWQSNTHPTGRGSRSAGRTAALRSSRSRSGEQLGPPLAANASAINDVSFSAGRQPAGDRRPRPHRSAVAA